uniref:Uncharacterized protein n=1 Tax=Macrostomum lignano TaxID=282301 RepID=A0A1I8F4P0_9PLAT
MHRAGHSPVSARPPEPVRHCLSGH